MSLLLGDLREMKVMLGWDPNFTCYDTKLLLLIEWASNIIENYIGRDLSFRTRTQFVQGTGTQKLLLKNRPVYPNPSGNFAPITVYEDTGGNFGATPGSFSNPPLVYGTDYTLQIDQDDGSSRSAILWRLNDYWKKPIQRQPGLLSPFVGPDSGSYKIVYTAGWTVDTLPSAFRAALNLLVAKLNFLFPLGMIVGSESYEERSISYIDERRNYLLGLVIPLIFYYKNWKF